MIFKFTHLNNIDPKICDKSLFEMSLRGLDHPNCVKILDSFVLDAEGEIYAVAVFEYGYPLKDFFWSSRFQDNLFKNTLKLIL